MSLTESAPPAFSARVSRHVGLLSRLAWPVILSRSGILLLALFDIAAVGRQSIDALGYFGIALLVFIPIMVGGLGFMHGVISVVSRRQGEGDFDGAVAAWRHGIAFGLAVGLAASALVWFTEDWLRLFGQNEALVAGGGEVGRALAPGALGQSLFIVCAFFLEGTGRPIPALVAMAVANVVNIALNWLLIDPYGAAGVAAATTVARFAMFAVLLAWVLADPRVRAALRRLQRGGFWGPGGWAAGREIRAIGVAGGVSNFFETAAFGALGQIAGHIGPGALAVYTIGNSVQATAFMGALGLGVATGVRVGSEKGAGRPAEAAFAGWTGLLSAMALMLALGLGAWAFSGPVTAFYTSDSGLAARVAPLLVIVAVALVFDGGQVVLGLAVRALGDTWIGATMICGGFALVMVPAAWALAVPAGMEARGLYLGTAIGCAVVTGLLAFRFHAMTRGARA